MDDKLELPLPKQKVKKQVKRLISKTYVLNINNEDGTLKETQNFENSDAICEYLKITKTKLSAIIQKKIKFVYINNQRFKNMEIKIERVFT